MCRKVSALFINAQKYTVDHHRSVRATYDICRAQIEDECVLAYKLVERVEECWQSLNIRERLIRRTGDLVKWVCVVAEGSNDGKEVCKSYFTSVFCI